MPEEQTNSKRQLRSSDHRSPFGVRRSAFGGAVHRSPFTVHRSAGRLSEFTVLQIRRTIPVCSILKKRTCTPSSHRRTVNAERQYCNQLGNSMADTFFD
jgi:hypothetical protein